MRSSLVFMLVCVACGGNSGNDDGGDGNGSGSPKMVAGGGVTGGPLGGELHVYVVAADTGAPIAGASVHAKSDATTDTTGLASFSDSGLSGAQMVSATATGYVAATWIGVAAADVTIPLQRSGSVPTATARGTLSLPSPSFGHYTLGLVLYSFLDDPSAPENAITQPTTNNVPRNACVRTTGGSNCSWELTTRIGKQIHTAIIVDGDPHGTTSDTSDDTYTFIGYAAGSVMTLTAGQQVMGESLAAVNGTTSLSISIPGAPAGLPTVAAIPELALGDAGRVVFPLPTIKGTGGAAQVLAPTAQFAGSYEIVALATPSATAKAPFSSTFAHGVSGSASLPPWLPAVAPSYNSGTFTFSTVAGAAFYTMQLSQGTTTLWNFTVLDKTTSFALPTLHLDPLAGASGSITFAVSAADVPGFSPTEFTIPNVKTMLARASGGEGTFTH